MNNVSSTARAEWAGTWQQSGANPDRKIRPILYNGREYYATTRRMISEDHFMVVPGPYNYNHAPMTSWKVHDLHELYGLLQSWDLWNSWSRTLSGKVWHLENPYGDGREAACNKSYKLEGLARTREGVAYDTSWFVHGDVCARCTMFERQNNGESR